MRNTLIESGKDHFIVRHEDDVSEVLENNKRLRSIEQDKRSEFRHKASIPPIVLLSWLNEQRDRGNTTIRAFGKEMDELIERKLRDPDWAFLLTDYKNHRVGFGS